MLAGTINSDPIIRVGELGFPWATLDPFLFCVYHNDAYPRGNDGMGPAATLDGRNLGNDFSRKDGWSMYHGTTVPGFPAHPHRGFETVTVVRKGFIDHSDSLGATARYGAGDVQWLTAGRGVVHSEMLPLVNTSAPNPLELFQIWLNLPSRSKMAEPRFTMYWAERAATFQFAGSGQGACTVTCIAGVPQAFAGKQAGAPPADSWAAQADADVAIWTVKMAPHAHLTLPAAAGKSTRRTLYFFSGNRMRIAGTDITRHSAVEVDAGSAVELDSGPQGAELLLLQGRPIGEPVVQYGPFVMNTEIEIRRTIEDYRNTGFGGWPWPTQAPVHLRTAARFARHPDGSTDSPPRPGA
jgi:redox-sensitive bicupin YhaK (pirin superfamily)